MSGQRYIALVAAEPGARSAWEQESANALDARPGFAKQLVGDRLALVVESCAALAIGGEGFLIGSTFERGRTKALTELSADSARSIVASRGAWLSTAHWGSYVALISARDRDSVEVVCAPFGTLGCYAWRSHYGLFLASDVDLLEAFAGFSPEIDWSALTALLVAGDLRRGLENWRAFTHPAQGHAMEYERPLLARYYAQRNRCGVHQVEIRRPEQI